MARILVVQGSMNPNSVTSTMCRDVARKMELLGAGVDFLDFRVKSLPAYIPGSSSQAENHDDIAALVSAADGYILGTPDYHGGPSGVLKNFLDYFWREFTGKLFGYICASHEKGLTPMDHLRTAVRQCYGWSLPYGIAGIEGNEVQKETTEAGGKILSNRLNDRLTMMANDMVVYTSILAEQRRRSLEGAEPSFLAILRGQHND